jgi:beta-glucosidase
MNQQYLDPLMLSKYPQEMREIFGEAWPAHSEDDMRCIAQPIDFLGINYYTREVIKHDDDHRPLRTSCVYQDGATHTETGWEVYPQGFTDILVWIKERYGDIPLYITENGAAFYDPPAPIDGVIEDPLRVAYLREHILAVHRAWREGVNVRGYFVWSLLDNFEWAHGYSKRFGIVHVNYETQQRTIKSSGHYYSRIIREGVSLL